MTRYDAIWLMQEGEKVRQSSWDKDVYIYMDSKRIIRDSFGNCYGFYRFFNNLCLTSKDNEWELYKMD